MGTISCERWQMSERITWLLHHQPTFAFVTKDQSFKRKNEQTSRRRTYISIFLGNCIVFGSTAAEGYNSVGVRFVAVWSAPLHARKKINSTTLLNMGHQNVKNVLLTYLVSLVHFGIRYLDLIPYIQNLIKMHGMFFLGRLGSAFEWN